MAENKADARRNANLQRVRDLAKNALLGSGKTFSTTIDYESNVGNYYSGNVVFHKPDMKDLMKMAGLKSMYIQQQFVDDEGNPMPVDPMLIDSMLTTVSEVISTLRVVVDQVDESLDILLDPESCDELDLLLHVFGRYQEWRNSFRKRDTAEPGQADRGTDSSESEMVSETLPDSNDGPKA